MLRLRLRLKNFKTSLLRLRLCDYSDAYILVKRNRAVENKAAQDHPNNSDNKKVILKNCVPFTNCISRTNNTQVDNAPDIDVVIPMYNVTEYNDNYSKTSAILLQYCRDEPAIYPTDRKIADFTEEIANTDSCKRK